MTRRIAVFVAIAVALAALFIRLGFWQLDRLAERRGRNAAMAHRLATPVTSFETLGEDAAYRRATVRGQPDSAHEIVWTGRSRSGSPGVYVLTPLRRAGSDTAVLVLRGWVYAPDAATIDLARWREARSEFTGYVLALPENGAQPAAAGGTNRRIRALTRPNVRALLPYPVAPFYLVARDSTAGTAPARLPMLTLDEGPHLGYAVQWFAFATIALVGAAAVALRARASERVARRMQNRAENA